MAAGLSMHADPWAGRWLDLGLGLTLAGCEERRRPGLRAFRDRRRPRLWDRHLALAGASPEAPSRDRLALDAYYRETRADQWSLLAREERTMELWSRELEPLGATAERLLLLDKEPRSRGAIDPRVVRLAGSQGFALLAALRESTSPESSARQAVGDLLALLAARAGGDRELVPLAVVEGGEALAAIVLTRVGRLAWLEDLETRPDRRGRGFGRALLRAAEEEAFLRGVARLGFDALASDWPWRWYRREGYRVAGECLRLRRALP